MALPLLEIPPQTPLAEVDEEILEIFTEEVQEVLETIVNSLDGWKRNPSSKDDLQTLRRAFHTLKGSGRLIGATVIGELGWRFESLLNRIIDGTLSRSTELLNLLGKVEGILPDLIEQFQKGEGPDYATRLLISQADYFTTSKGQSLGDFAGPGEPAEGKPAPVKVKAEPAAPPAKAAIPVPAAASPKPVAPPEVPKAPPKEAPKPAPKAPEPAKPATAKEAPKPATPPAKPAVPVPPPAPVHEEEDEEEEYDPVLMGIFQNEAKNHLDQVKKFLLHGRRNPPCMATSEVVRALHTLNGSSRSVNLPGIAALAAPMESYMRGCMEHKLPIKNEVLALIVESGKLLEAYIVGRRDAKTAAPSSALAAAWQNLAGTLPEREPISHEPHHPAEAKPVEAKPVEAKKETAKPVTLPPVKEQSKPQPKPVAEAKPAAKVEASKKNGEMATEAADEFMDIFLEEAEEILETSQSLVGRWLASPNSLPLIKELQRELHTLKGGARMVGISVMGDLSHHLESVLTRLAEGNAQSNPRLQSLVQESLDELAAMLEAVRAGVTIEPAVSLIEQINSSLSGDSGAAPPPPKKAPPASAEAKKAATQKEESASAPPTASETAPAEGEKAAAEAGGETGGADAEERVRVRATLIDKLTNLAGEMSILRAHLEQQQGAFKISLVEMEQTVFRLRDQLRRLEIETEAQMTSHFHQPGAGPDREEFDPLEMDRFSAMQQLSRSLMESVSDLLSIQDAMKNLIRHNDSLLIQQSRIGAELQDGIMRTRMVPFSQISPRLQRIARLTSKELHKKVDFLISDETMEFERTVLNRVVAPLEHLLRNAIGHGVESPNDRVEKGKSANATVRIDLFKEGAELILRLSDDGAGLNMDAIRAKAIERGMIQRDSEVTEAQLAQFILEPAFSTAKTITQVSGRGVGMDIVNSEVKQLGGTLLIFSARGKGTTFEIRLPMSLTISMALLVHLGEETLAVPLHNIDAVMRVSRQEVNTTNNEETRYYRYMDHDYRIFHLGEMLGFGRSSIDANLLPVLLVHSVDQRVALVVDGIEGSREVVVKAVGAQLSIIRWIAGATILGDGRVVIILDVLALMRAHTGALMSHLSLTMPGDEEAVAPGVVIKTILVVDDSITVRKVTARLLKRQGLDVMTAKDGVDAVSQLQDRIPDLMLLDVEMPRMDGYELATQVRNDERLRHIPIIMITSRTGMKHRERAEKIGVNRYLGKPFNETELLENISSLLAEKK